MQPPFLTFIIPCYNRAWCIRECLDSVTDQAAGQARHDVEVVVVDDGSTDDTPDLLSEYHHPALRIVRLPQNTGPARARNAGIREATGEFLVFLDSDDRLLPGGLNVIRERILATNRQFAGYWFNCIGSETGEPTGIAPADGWTMRYEDLLAGTKVRGEFLPVARRAEFAGIGYVESCRGGEDLAWLELLRRHGPFHVCLTPVRWYRQHSPDSVLAAIERVVPEQMQNMLRRAEYFLEHFGEDAARINPSRLREEHFRAAYAAVYLKRFHTARRHLDALENPPVRALVLRLCCLLRSRLPQTLSRKIGALVRTIRREGPTH